MTDCCADNKPEQDKKLHCCPVNGKTYNSVKLKTLLHHISQPWKKSLPEQTYYFCTDPNCEVVYYGEDDSVININEIRTSLWQKQKDKNAPVCHCFGVTREQALTDDNIKLFVTQQTSNATCSCETSNPSGKCCLKDFPRH